MLSLAQEWIHVALDAETFAAIRTGSLPLMALCGLSCAVCYLFAFAPTGWYARWLAPATAEEC